MTIPSTSFIEAGSERLFSRTKLDLENQAAALQQLALEIKEEIVAVTDGDEMLAGYLLGLETMRAMLVANTSVQATGMAIGGGAG